MREFKNCTLFCPDNKALYLTQFTWGGHYGPPYRISISCYRVVRGRFTKFHDFVPFGICQDPVKLLLTFFPKKMEKMDIKNFWGVLEH